MADLTLTHQHPDFVATTPARTKSRDLYGGSEAVKAAGETYLFRFKNETQDVYAERLKRAALDPYVEKIINARQAILFAKPHLRELPEQAEEFLYDVDARGTSATAFFADVARDAQIDGIHWVLVDMPKLAGPVFVSAKEERESGHRPFFQRIPAASVIDWEVGPDHRLLWAVVTRQQYRTRDRAGAAPEKVTEYVVWYRDRWELFEEGKGGTRLIAQQAHDLNAVPLVPFFGIKRTDYSGLPVTHTILDHIILLYNKRSDLDNIEQVAAHPSPYCISMKKPVKLDVAKGFWIESAPPGIGQEVGILEISGNSLAALRESNDRLEQVIYATALAQAKRDSAQVQSSDSQREDRRIFTASLKALSAQYEGAEEQCWNLLLDWLGVSARAEVAYNRDFDDSMIDANMVQIISGIQQSGQLSLETLLIALKEGEVLPELDIEEELRRVQQESGVAAKAALANLRSEL